MLLIYSKLKVDIHHKYTFVMHNLKTNFDKIFHITKLFFKDSIDSDCNLQFYPKKPKMSDCEIITLSILGESVGIDSENYLFGKLESDHKSDFPNLIDRSRFNRRRKRLGDYISKLNRSISSLLNQGEDTYLIDSIPIPVCKIVREKRLKICKKDFDTAPDKGYVSKSYRTDLFSTRQIRLRTPMRDNQNDKEPYPFIFKRSRYRIETLFAQLCDQYMLKRNYAKTMTGLAIRLLCKITSVTILQYINSMNNKPINHLKYALAS